MSLYCIFVREIGYVIIESFSWDFRMNFIGLSERDYFMNLFHIKMCNYFEYLSFVVNLKIITIIIILITMKLAFILNFNFVNICQIVINCFIRFIKC